MQTHSRTAHKSKTLMKKNYDFYAITKKNWNNGEGLPDACDALRESVNKTANAMLAELAKKGNRSEDGLFHAFDITEVKADNYDAETTAALGIPEGTTCNMMLGHPLFQLVFFSLYMKGLKDLEKGETA